MSWIRQVVGAVKAAKSRQIFALQVRNKSDKKPETKTEKELVEYDNTIKKEMVVDFKTEAELAKVPPEVLVKVLPKPVESRNRVLIVGAGTGGLAVANELIGMANGMELDIGIIDHSKVHYNETSFPLIGFNKIKHRKTSTKLLKDVVPPGVTLIEDRVTEFHPTKNFVKTVLNRTVHYDALVVATGLNKSYNSVAGLEDPLLRDNRLRTLIQQYASILTKQRLKKPEDNPLTEIEARRSVESIASAHFYDSSGDVQRILTQNIDENGKGKIVFALESSTNVAEPEILYSVIFMLHDKLKSMKVRHNHTIDLYFPGDKAPLLEVDMLSDKLKFLLKQFKINLFPRHNLVSIDEEEREAVFTQPGSKAEIKVPFIGFHFTPAAVPDRFVTASSLVTKSGLVNINLFTLQHKDHKNVFSLGSCAFPLHTTAGTALRQSSVVAYNVLNQLSGKPGLKPKYYDGWNAAPIMTGLKSAIIYEWNDDGILLKPTIKGSETLIESRYTALIYQWCSRFYYEIMDMKRYPKAGLSLISPSEKAVDYKPAPPDFTEQLIFSKEEIQAAAKELQDDDITDVRKTK
jgi:sulfide:quinone oxidoreductase